MTDTIHNLDDQTDVESFRFKLNDNIYTMRYPTTEEITKAQKLTDLEKVEWIYGYIEPEDSKAPAIKEALGKKSVKFLQGFNKMVIEEFGG